MTLTQNPLCNPVCRVCHYKNLDYPTQLVRKQEWALQQLEYWKEALQVIRPAPERERLAYRSKSWLRSSFQGGVLSFGMYRSVQVLGRWEKEFVSWDSCPLHVRPIQQMIQKLQKNILREDFEFLEQALVGLWMGSPHLVIVSRDPVLERMKQIDWASILVPPFDRVWFHSNSQVGKKIFGHRPIETVVGPPDHLIHSVVHPIRAFRQVAQSLLVEARQMALEALLRYRPDFVLDLYCGTGELSQLLPPEIGWIGIEISKEAVIYANSLQSSSGALRAAFAGAVEHRLKDPNVLNKVNGSYSLYVNPPRSGLSEEAREKILILVREKPPLCIVYLSCSASSLSRDLRSFEREGFKVKFLQPYDFFPQTEHFETLAILEHPPITVPKSFHGRQETR